MVDSKQKITLTINRESIYFGERNQNNKLDGRGFIIRSDGEVSLGYFKDGFPTTGNYILTRPNGDLQVGEMYEEVISTLTYSVI